MGMDGMRFIASCGDSGVGRGYPCPRGSQDTACIKNTRRGNATAVDIKYRVVAGIDGGNQAASVRPRIGGRQRAVPDRDQGSVSGCLECAFVSGDHRVRSEEHTSELQSLMRISYAVFCLKKKK